MAERKPAAARELGKAIRRLRTERRLSQFELGQAAGDYSESYIAHIERGARRPTDTVLRGIAQALGTDYNDLAAIAGYIDAPTGDVTIQVSPAWNRVIRKAMRWPADRVDTALDALDLFYHPGLRGVDREQQQAEEEADDEAEQGAPEDTHGAGSGS